MRSQLPPYAVPILIPLFCMALLIAATSHGCGQPPLDKSLLTGEPCEPPCWQGLTPGVSTHEQVNEFIRTSRLVNPQTLHISALRAGDGQRVGVSISWRTTVAPGRGYHDLARKGGVLKDIIIYPDYDITLDSLLEKYGPPEKVNVGITGSFGHVPAVGVTLFYPTNGFTAYFELPIDDARLGPDSTVLRLWYSQAAPLERFLELGKGYLGGTPEQWLESLREWPGYGQLELP
jgi:hypothetical protein